MASVHAVPSVELAGPPGAGKSTIARLLAEETGLVNASSEVAQISRAESALRAPRAAARSITAIRSRDRAMFAAVARQQAIARKYPRVLIDEGPVHLAWILGMRSRPVRPRSSADLVVFLSVDRAVAAQRLLERTSKVGRIGNQLASLATDDPEWDRCELIYRGIVEEIQALVVCNSDNDPGGAVSAVLAGLQQRKIVEL